ncbi:Cof-type HAD-IIB family hydrolase [Necropsobacter rosorum]|uniref:Cof-type HAD-IIB family hydrolase n=1 Tax=Necropsobacter rosorum TaxID=908285 RepID=UPI000509C509
MSTYKAVFSDMDGTLLNSRHQISPATFAAIRRIIRRGVAFIPVSARPPYAITPYTQQLQTRQAIICYSGALILDNDLHPLYSVSLQAQDLPALEKDLTNFPHLSVSYYAGLDWFTDNSQSDWIKQEAEITGLTAKSKPNHLPAVHKILVMGEGAEIARLEKQLQHRFPQLSVHRSKGEYLEIMHKAASKAKAIRFMETYLNISARDVIAFGDNFNDLDMLQYAGFSVAMGNAPDAIKQAAKLVTAGNDDDGIALVLNRLFT